MEVTPVTYDKEEYIETVCILSCQWNLLYLMFQLSISVQFQASGNKVSRKTVLCGSQNIVLNGKVIVQTGAIIRGDLSNVRTGRYCVISQKAVIRPAYKQFSTG